MQRKVEFGIGEYYHIYNRGVEKRDIFLTESDRIRFQKLLYLTNGTRPIIFRQVQEIQGRALYEYEKGKQVVAIGAYTLMSNHFHLLIRETEEGGITNFMQKLTTSYSMYFNKVNKRVGPLFQGRFKAEHVDTDEYLKYLFAYIHLNPVKTVDAEWKNKRIGDPVKAKAFLKSYPYSSYLDLVGLKRSESAILATKEFPGYFSRKAEFEDFVDEWMNYDNEKGFKAEANYAKYVEEEGEHESMAQFLEE